MSLGRLDASLPGFNETCDKKALTSMPLRHLAYSLYACNSNMLSTASSSGLFPGAGLVRHCSSNTSTENSKVGSKPPIALPPTKRMAIGKILLLNFGKNLHGAVLLQFLFTG